MRASSDMQPLPDFSRSSEVGVPFLVTPTCYEELSSGARKRFESYSARYILPDFYVPRDFSSLWKLHDPEDETTIFLARQTRDEEMIYFFGERQTTGQMEFYGEIGYDAKESSETSYLHYIWVEEALRKEWIASKRVLLFNAASEFFFQKPLRVGTNFLIMRDSEGKIIYPVERIFTQLEKQWLATREPNNTGYQFNSQVANIISLSQ